jgi:hypothetical protein
MQPDYIENLKLSAEEDRRGKEVASDGALASGEASRGPRSGVQVVLGTDECHWIWCALVNSRDTFWKTMNGGRGREVDSLIARFKELKQL